MNAHLQRGRMLLQQQRPKLAEESLRRALGEEPNSAQAHSLLALALTAQEKFSEAEREAGHAVGLEPDNPFVHYVRAHVLENRNKLADAEAAIRQAVALDPSDADYHAMLARILLQREEREQALAAAEEALRFDPEHVSANNLRAMALTQLGRSEEAAATIEETLAQDPDNALTHANRAWTLLHQGKTKEALPHFRDALRLDPTLEWARAGCVEALKAGNPVYAVMLRYFLWTARLSSQARWMLFLGLWFGHRFLRGLAQSNPAWAPWIAPITALYLIFVLSTWLADPLFNLVLRLSPYGRHLLSDDQRRQAHAVGLALLCGLIWLALWLLTGLQHTPFLLAAGAGGALTLPLAAIFSCPSGWPRTTMTVVAAILGCLAVRAFATAAHSWFTGANSETAWLFFGPLVLGTVLSTWLTAFLSTRQVER